MNLKNIVLITLLLLAVFTISTVSASEDIDTLAVSDISDEKIAEVPNSIGSQDNNDLLGDPNPADFNVTIKDKMDIKDSSAAVTFDWPDYVKEKNESLVPDFKNDHVSISVESGSDIIIYRTGDATSVGKTIDDLYIWDTGVYNITVSYNDDLVLANALLNITKSTTQSYTADDLIELYSDYPVEGSEGYVCTVYDPDFNGVNGNVSVFINGKLAYYKEFNGVSGGKTVWGKNLTGTFNGAYTVKVVYKRAADGKEYSKQVTNNFINVIGSGTLPTTATNTNTNSNSKTQTKVTVASSKITAKKATFKKSSKNKKYTVTLTSGKKIISKVKVTLKVGKKTYKATTNAKGKATFNLKKLTKKGKYTANIKFAGNKNFKASSANVKITVK